MTVHAKYPLRRPGIAKILDLLFTVPTFEAGGTEGLVSGENRQVFDLVAAGAAAVCAVVANEGTITEEEKVCVGVEECTTGVASKAVDMPPVSS